MVGMVGMVWVNGGWEGEGEGRRNAGPAAVVICRGATSGHRGVVLGEKLRLNMILSSDRRDSQSGWLSAAVAVPSSVLRFLMPQTRNQARPAGDVSSCLGSGICTKTKT